MGCLFFELADGKSLIHFKTYMLFIKQKSTIEV